MNFLEADFLLFSVLVALVAWLCERHPQRREVWLVIASLAFLASWNWQSCVVATVNAGFVFGLGRAMANSKLASSKLAGIDGMRNRWLLVVGVAAQILLLIVARYLTTEGQGSRYNEKLISFTYLVGVSYLTLQNIAYLIQVHGGEISAERRFMRFWLYSIYFPKILAGPIEDYGSFSVRLGGVVRKWSLAESVYLIALGLFKSLVVSSHILQLYQQMISGYPGPEKPILAIWAAVVMTPMIMYCDFSALNDVGRGVSQLLGISLTQNFNQPYFATNPFDYWNRWHITMASWMRRYVYYPVLLKSKSVIVAVVLTMLTTALWHGVSPMLFFWAGLWILFQIGYILIRRLRPPVSGSQWRRIGSMLFTFHVSGLIGLYTIHLLFFPLELPHFSVLYDPHSLTTAISNYVIWILVIFLLVVETYERRVGRDSELFYVIASVVLAFLTATFMSGSSYLFYYMRL